MKKTRGALPALAAVAAVAIAGCGGSEDSSSDLAGFASPGSLVFLEAELEPSGELKADADAVAATVAGADSLGDLVVEEIEEAAREDGERLDFDAEVRPWLGERAAVAFAEIEDGDLTDPLVLVETTDPEATQRFVDERTREGEDRYRDASYEGVEFRVGGSEDQAIGVLDDFLVVAEGERGFEAAVDASEGESLGDEAGFQRAISAASQGSLADVYLDVGRLVEGSDERVDPRARRALESAGIDLSEATAVASVIPGEERVEIEVSSETGDQEAPSGEASELLGTMPADAFAAFATSGFGEQVKDAIDELDSEGVPGQVPPNQLKSTLRAAGIDLDRIADSLEDAAVFAQGSNEASLGGALVLTSDSGEAAKTVANLGVLLRSTGTPGVTAIARDGASGFSVRSEDLGRKPLVVVAEGRRIAIGYGVAPALRGLAPGAETLSGTPAYEAAVSALGDTPIGAFAAGPAALRLADAMVSAEDRADFREARPYLDEIAWIGVGSGSDGELATAKVIVGLEE